MISSTMSKITKFGKKTQEILGVKENLEFVQNLRNLFHISKRPKRFNIL
jgi:hypothetical protein